MGRGPSSSRSSCSSSVGEDLCVAPPPPPAPRRAPTSPPPPPADAAVAACVQASGQNHVAAAASGGSNGAMHIAVAVHPNNNAVNAGNAAAVDPAENAGGRQQREAWSQAIRDQVRARPGVQSTPRPRLQPSPAHPAPWQGSQQQHMQASSTLWGWWWQRPWAAPCASQLQGQRHAASRGTTRAWGGCTGTAAAGRRRDSTGVRRVLPTAVAAVVPHPPSLCEHVRCGPLPCPAALLVVLQHL